MHSVFDASLSIQDNAECMADVLNLFWKGVDLDAVEGSDLNINFVHKISELVWYMTGAMLVGMMCWCYFVMSWLICDLFLITFVEYIFAT